MNLDHYTVWDKYARTIHQYLVEQFPTAQAKILEETGFAASTELLFPDNIVWVYYKPEIVRIKAGMRSRQLVKRDLHWGTPDLREEIAKAVKSVYEEDKPSE